jgi:hypothetical protein
MPKIFAVFAFFLSLAFSQRALACEDGERRVGPVCVDQSGVKAGSWVHVMSRVYFDDDPNKKTVWNDLGYVESATRTKLEVIEKRLVDGEGMQDVHVIYVWNGQEFVEKKKR